MQSDQKLRVQIIYCWYNLRIIIFVFFGWVNLNSTVFLYQNFVCNLLLEFLHFKQQSIPFHHLKLTYPLNNSMFTNVEHKMYFQSFKHLEESSYCMKFHKHFSQIIKIILQSIEVHSLVILFLFWRHFHSQNLLSLKRTNNSNR